jgi:hypothetical protein
MDIKTKPHPAGFATSRRCLFSPKKHIMIVTHGVRGRVLGEISDRCMYPSSRVDASKDLGDMDTGDMGCGFKTMYI